MRRLLRWLLPALVLVAWLGISGVGGPYFGLLGEVQSQSATDFLPATAESTRVADIQRATSSGNGLPAIIVVANPDGLDEAALSALSGRLDAIRAIDGVAAVSPPIPSQMRTDAGNPEAVEIFATVTGDPDRVVTAMRDAFADVSAGTEVHVAGPAGFAADLTEAFGGIDSMLLLVAVGAVLIILVVVYRSPILPFVVVFTAVSALAASVVAVYEMAAADWIVLNGQAQGILFILVVGATTDYALLLVSRYRDALREEASHLTALMRAWKGVLEPIAASAGTVIAALLCLLISDLNSNKALGPVAAVGIVCAFLAALTMLPALLALIGRAVFFPAIPRPDEGTAEHHALWARIAHWVETRPRAIWTATAVVLLALAAFAPQIHATGVSQSDLLLGKSDAVTGQEVIGRYFAAGSGAPVVIIVPDASVAAAVTALQGDDAVAEVTRGDSFTFEGIGLTEVDATLVYAADSEEALAAVGQLRDDLHAIDGGILVGGQSATTLDTRDAATRDLWTIVPIIVLVTAIILVLLLRSVLAPILLIATTVISYFATLGFSGLVFTHLFGFPGADPAVPLFAFVFLVALGIDYNIFLATRIREEAVLHGTRPGILRGLKVTGGVITSAGVVLAATFAALAVIPILFLVQIAFIVALGVLLDTTVVRSLLVPSLFHDIGDRIWWPSSRRRRPASS